MDQLNIGSPNSAEVRNLTDKETLMWEDIEIYASNRVIDFNLIHIATARVFEVLY